jgi:hypothetical protein
VAHDGEQEEEDAPDDVRAGISALLWSEANKFLTTLWWQQEVIVQSMDCRIPIFPGVMAMSNRRHRVYSTHL